MAVLKYGTFSHPLNEMSVTFTEVGRFSERGVYIGRRETWNVEGTLIGDLTSLKSQIALIDTEYRTQALDLTLFEDETETGIIRQQGIMAGRCCCSVATAGDRRADELGGDHCLLGPMIVHA